MQLLQMCRLHIYDANLPFHHIPKCSIGLSSVDCGYEYVIIEMLSIKRFYKSSEISF